MVNVVVSMGARFGIPQVSIAELYGNAIQNNDRVLEKSAKRERIISW